MNLRTYRAYTLQQALDAVREDLGPGAVILRTATARRRGFMGLGSQTIVEVTASDGPPPPSFRLPELPADDARPAAGVAADRAPGEPPRGASSQERARRLERAVRRRAEESAATGPSGRPPATRPAEPPATPPERRAPAVDASPPVLDLETERRRTRELAQRMLAEHERASGTAAAGADETEGESSRPEPKPTPESSAPPAVPAPRRPISVPPPREPDEPAMTSVGPRPPHAAVARRVVLRPADESSASAPAPPPPDTPDPDPDPDPDPAPAVPPVVPPVTPRPSSGGRVGRPPARARDEELEAIGGLVGEVLRDAAERRRDPLPPGLFAHHLTLVGGEMSQELAETITDAVHRELSEEQLGRPEAVAAAVHRQVAGRIPVAAEPIPARSPDGRPLTLAFVGPTGVGKTTTVAKLAAALHLRQGRSVGLVTTDTYRIAAIEQLRTYADIIGVPMRVAMDAESMREATLSMADRDVILIDTAGRSQRDADRIAELRGFIRAAEPHDVHMVLSGIAGHRALRREADAFRRVGVHKLVLTKLDEAVSFGMLVEAVMQIDVPLSFLTVGQEVPDDLEWASADRLADLALESTDVMSAPGDGGSAP